VLTDLRVLEISAQETMQAGRILADLGADVVIVEPPGGATGRRLGPFVDGEPGLERSLSWLGSNLRKRAITLDLDDADGEALFMQLLDTVDVLIEAPGAPPARPVGDRVALPERVVHCVIRPVAEDGPKSGYATSELVLAASSGAVALVGDQGRPPPMLPVPQVERHAGADAAAAVLAALAARERDGRGQRVSVSARLAAATAAFSHPIIGSGMSPAERPSGERLTPTVVGCADGGAIITIAFGRAFGPKVARLAAWVHDRGRLSAELAGLDWPAMLPETVPEDGRAVAALVVAVAEVCGELTRAEVEAAAGEWGFLAASVNDPGDVARSPELASRPSWTEAEVDGRMVTAPLDFPTYSNHRPSGPRRAPRLGEHNAEILGGELGLRADERAALFAHGIL
jgi:benzylsuccinate CoA-transferase BbsE subunit